MSDARVTIRGKAPGEADFFYTLDRVLGGLLAALKGGRIDEAVDVYTRCREDIGYQLIARAQLDPVLFKQVANLFFRARDFARAAYCCEHLGESEKAAALYERCDDWAQAGQMYAAVGKLEKAAEMYEKGGNHAEAARIFRDLGADLRAAACFERANRPFDAATMYQRAGRIEKAIEVLNLVDDGGPDRRVADKLVKELIAAASLKRSETQQIPAQTTPSAVAGVLPSGATAPEPILAGGGQLADGGKNIVTVMEGFEVLRELPLFGELSLTELKSLYHLCDKLDVPAGTGLIRAGAPAPALFCVIEGGLEVRTTGGDVVARLGPGEHAGEMGLLDDAPATVDVVASAPARVLRLDRGGFRDVLGANDALAVRVMRVMLQTLAARLRETTAKVAR